MLKTFAEFRAEIPIIDFATNNGYQLDKSKGLKWPVLRCKYNDDVIIIVNPQKPSNQGYFNPDDDSDKGTLINFIKNRLGTLFIRDSNITEVKNINRILYDYLKIDNPGHISENLKIKIAEKKIKPFSPANLLPLKSINYLLSRYISEETIFDPIFENRIYNYKSGQYKNIAFPYWDASGKVIGIEERNSGFKFFLEGSLLTNAAWYSNYPAKLENVAMFESAIDALSYYQLRKPSNTFFIAFGGSLSDGQMELTKNILSKHQIPQNVKFVCCFDNDKSGLRYANKIKTFFTSREIKEDIPQSKDFNKDLENYLRS